MDKITLGTQIHNNSELVALPVGTLLVDNEGNSARICNDFGKKFIVTQGVTGVNSPRILVAELELDISYDAPYTVVFVR